MILNKLPVVGAKWCDIHKELYIKVWSSQWEYYKATQLNT